MLPQTIIREFLFCTWVFRRVKLAKIVSPPGLGINCIGRPLAGILVRAEDNPRADRAADLGSQRGPRAQPGKPLHLRWSTQAVPSSVKTGYAQPSAYRPSRVPRQAWVQPAMPSCWPLLRHRVKKKHGIRGENSKVISAHITTTTAHMFTAC